MVTDCRPFELLDYRADLGVVSRRWSWLVVNIALVRREHTPDAIDKLQGILLVVEVDVERVKLVVVLGLVMRVVCWQMPLFVTIDLANRQSHKAGVVVIVLEMGSVEVWRHMMLAFSLPRSLIPKT